MTANKMGVEPLDRLASYLTMKMVSKHDYQKSQDGRESKCC